MSFDMTKEYPAMLHGLEVMYTMEMHDMRLTALSGPQGYLVSVEYSQCWLLTYYLEKDKWTWEQSSVIHDYNWIKRTGGMLSALEKVNLRGSIGDRGPEFLNGLREMLK